jgi:hypothetical protein
LHMVGDLFESQAVVSQNALSNLYQQSLRSVSF